MITPIKNLSAHSDEERVYRVTLEDTSGNGIIDEDEFNRQIEKQVRDGPCKDAYPEIDFDTPGRGRPNLYPNSVNYTLTDKGGTAYTKQQIGNFYKNGQTWLTVSAPGESASFDLRVVKQVD